MKAIRSSKHAVMARSRARTCAGVGAAAVNLAAGLVASAPSASALTEYSTPAITVAAGNSVIAVQTSGDGLRFYWNQYGTDTWRGEQVAPNRTTFSAPSIAQDGNTVVIAVQGTHNSLDFYWALNGTSTWHAQTVAPARTTVSAPTIASNGGAANVTVQGWDNSLDFYWQQNDTPAWNLQVVDPGDSLFGGPPGDDGPPAITTYSDGVDDAVKVLAQGTFLTEWTAFNGGGNWSWQHVNTDFAYSAATITENNGSDNIAVFGNGGELDFYWLDDRGAFQKEVVAAAGVN